MSKHPPKPKQPRKRPPRLDTPLGQTLLWFAQPTATRIRQVTAARAAQLEQGADLIYDLALRYGYRCVCCGTTRRLGLDHIRPVSKGGQTVIENLQLMCRDCNLRKGNQIIDYRPAPGKG